MARSARPLEQLTKESKHFWITLNSESTALACVLVGAAGLEQALMSLLLTFLIEGETSVGLFKENGVLGDLSSCAQLAYCLAPNGFSGRNA